MTDQLYQLQTQLEDGSWEDWDKAQGSYSYVLGWKHCWLRLAPLDVFPKARIEPVNPKPTSNAAEECGPLNPEMKATS